MLGESEQNGPRAVTPFNFRVVGKGSPSIDLQGLVLFFFFCAYFFSRDLYFLHFSSMSSCAQGLWPVWEPSLVWISNHAYLRYVRRVLALQRAQVGKEVGICTNRPRSCQPFFLHTHYTLLHAAHSTPQPTYLPSYLLRQRMRENEPVNDLLLLATWASSEWSFSFTSTRG